MRCAIPVVCCNYKVRGIVFLTEITFTFTLWPMNDWLLSRRLEFAYKMHSKAKCSWFWSFFFFSPYFLVLSNNMIPYFRGHWCVTEGSEQCGVVWLRICREYKAMWEVWNSWRPKTITLGSLINSNANAALSQLFETYSYYIGKPWKNMGLFVLCFWTLAGNKQVSQIALFVTSATVVTLATGQYHSQSGIEHLRRTVIQFKCFTFYAVVVVCCVQNLSFISRTFMLAERQLCVLDEQRNCLCVVWTP
jgi:hypothetical protein